MNRTEAHPLVRASMTTFRDNILATSLARSIDPSTPPHLSGISWLRRGAEAFIISWALDSATVTPALMSVYDELSKRAGLSESSARALWLDVIASFVIQGWITDDAAGELRLR